MGRKRLFRALLMAACALGLLFAFSGGDTPAATQRAVSKHWAFGLDSSCNADPPFSGAFSRFRRISCLPPRNRRITIVTVWTSSGYKDYLRHFMYSVQSNAAHVDLVFINRHGASEACVDWEAHGVNVTWGGNVRMVCMANEEWIRRHLDELCGPHGWACTQDQRADVGTKLARDLPNDGINVSWRPLLGYVVGDLFPNPGNPLWAYMDVDTHLGRFSHFPFNILSEVSILTFAWSSPVLAFLAGQFTAWNKDSKQLRGAWRRMPTLQTPEHFTAGLNGEHPGGVTGEGYWSHGYLRSDENLAGSGLSWAVLPDYQYTEDRWEFERGLRHRNVISGHDVLSADFNLKRKELEGLVSLARSEPVDDLGGAGWTPGVDTLQLATARQVLAAAHNGTRGSRAGAAKLERNLELLESLPPHEGIVDTVQLVKGAACREMFYLWFRDEWGQCVEPHPLTTSTPSILRASLVRFADSPPGVVHRRLERDQRSRTSLRRLFVHYQEIKRREWFKLPQVDVTDDRIMLIDNDQLDLFQIGSERDINIWHKKKADPKKPKS